MHLLGFVLDLDGLGAGTAIDVVGDTAKAELKSRAGNAAELAHGRDQLTLVDKTVHAYTPV